MTQCRGSCGEGVMVKMCVLVQVMFAYLIMCESFGIIHALINKSGHYAGL